jgi:hypothetical protein
MGGWCQHALQTVKSNIEGVTAQGGWEVLKLFCDLKEIALQDAAVMGMLHPERRNHMLCQMPVFQSDSFRTSAGWLMLYQQQQQK